MPRRILRPLLASLAVAAITCSVAACSSSSSTDTSSGGSGGDSGATTAPTKLFDTDFQAVCQGATQSKATAYDVTATGHKVLYFETYKDSLVQSGSKLPTDWQVQFDANRDAYADTDLVACAVRKSDAFVKDCTGYTDKDDKETGNVAKLHTATYELTVHEATTGKTLGTTTLEATGTDCPMFVSFESDRDTLDYYDTPTDDEVVAFIKPFAQPDKPAG